MIQTELQRPRSERSPVTQAIASPSAIKKQYPLNDSLKDQVARHRFEVEQIVKGNDTRLLVIVGPCSLHCNDAAIEYAMKLAELAEQLKDRFLIVMRAYLEKPRTTVGWKGMLNDPDLVGDQDLGRGIERSRQLLIRLLEQGLPLATEALSPLAINYLDDLVSWVAVGARTTESQTHREMASHLPCAVGFKNGTDGGLEVAINALLSASQPHSFLSMSQDGFIHQIQSTGNTVGQLVLRGGRSGPNYDAVHLANAKKQLMAAGLNPSVVVDCSHENSAKDHTRQSDVARDVIQQKYRGCDVIKGLMLESHLQEGRQSISSSMTYGQSITDACIGWSETEGLLRELHAAL